MTQHVTIIGGGLAGSEAALSLADRGIAVRLWEMRPVQQTAVHHSGDFAELVCSNSLKSMKPDSAAGLLKEELTVLGSPVLAAAKRHAVAAGGALAVDRVQFAAAVTEQITAHPLIEVIREEATDLGALARQSDALVLASGPLTSDGLSSALMDLTGRDALAFYDAAAPVVMADSIDMDKVFRQSRYEDAESGGDYLNAPFTREEYDAFIEELLGAERVIKKDFESKDLFQACQPIEEIARAGHDAPRFGTLKPVGLTDPRTGRRPWAALQLRAEDAFGTSYNLVGFQTNLTFPEQRRVFSMIPGLEQAEFARYGVMHRNTFIDAPRLLDNHNRLRTPQAEALGVPVYVVGQLAGTEGYCEAIRSGLHGALAVTADLRGVALPELSVDTVYGALLNYATDEATVDYQPMHVNFGIMCPFEQRIRNKKERYRAYADRANAALADYRSALEAAGLMTPLPA
ncbi:methylenetetrahydrofolate--tRNA-(uracil(54)-C(5))-methyltransferase (FADH(2)-oxidizing) TrmFO [Adlercreutzia equolifaciens]|uniref:methylenetetrahydrofolate--tRNA-(uracil(54)- C(5))-methyltransferase (FADH(2)-oxidizing) TrmFO n=1 Tax=Adlercreutzia equolifaciens TaxID=446660 RepID=UPI0023B149C8|nr:methylenetetrahydrofolate--tRNA-(uracil(54)-C(5))-methyltransferase (FADH(2)-oxidizing) TrmFO [Adlercreutzia equolifaciens]MDE8703051.1 methylenetetrahydrofolate--tRNA-(uracil(54)-C(5))-methyltransferase (FADH(2)-oxidizing) TrmFO [Adlercreutzia equolifaciens]